MKDKYDGEHVKAEFLEDIGPEAINNFISKRIELNNWSPKSANLLRQILHKLFAYAIKHHGFRSRDRRYPNPVTYVERYREPATVIRFLSLKQIDEQLKVLEKFPVMHALCATYIYAGLRREEALWLTKEDILLDKRLIKVQAKTIDGKFWQPKTKSNRVVPISSALYEILQSYKSSGSKWFFHSPEGKQWNPDNFSNDLREINKKNNLEWSCLDFRHTFGSHLAQKGESLYKISKLMGNSPEICRKHYAALIPEEMADVVEFTEKTPVIQNDNETQELLRELLSEIKGKGNPKIKISR
ncbi:MAG: tyrosine-type recombinase/integrase [Planctomycetaceae bacterium]|nr:tyrosine-type recombinase/integrase [Planctomycetaceae bacterium]